MDVNARREAAEALRAIKRGGEGWFSLSEAVMGRPAPRDEVVARLADLIDPGKDVSVSAYDLLSEEDRETLRWVKKSGGIDAVQKEMSNYTALCRSIQDADNRRAELCSALGIDTETGWSDAMGEMMRRLMPEGCEWPRFEDGELVEIGDKIKEFSDSDPRRSVGGIEFYTGGRVMVTNDSGFRCDRKILPLRKGEFVKHPVVLAADGEPLEAGQTVWLVDSFGKPNKERKISEILRHDRDLSCTIIKFTDGYSTDCGNVTHERPVLDADGVPIHEGDHGWWVEQPGVEIVVKHIDPDECDQLTVCDVHGRGNTICADEFTHTKPEPPDSWERIEFDLRKGYIEYWGCSGCSCSDCPSAVDGKRPMDLFDASCKEAMHKDIVRRCKALAERERGE